MMKEEKSYPILSLTKEDLRDCVDGLDNEKELLDKIDKLDDSTMQRLAQRLGELYCETDYWNTLHNLTMKIIGDDE